MSNAPRERRIVFPWERRMPVLSWFSRRHARAAVLALATGLSVYALVALEGYHRRTHATRAAIRSIMLGVDAFRADHGRCPSGVTELAHPPKGSGPYLREARLDGWGRPFLLVCPGRRNPSSADVISGGPTGTFLDLEQIE